MRQSSLFLAVVGLVAVAGCQGAAPAAPPVVATGPASQPAVTEHGDHGAVAKVGREVVDADGVVRRGVALSGEPTLTVAEAAAKSAELDGKVIKLTGKVDSVCQPMGCWMVLAGDKGEKVRVSSKGHDIFLPKSSAGRLATVEGEFKQKVLSKEQAQHFEDERELKEGEVRKVFTEDAKEFSVNVVGLELKPAA